MRNKIISLIAIALLSVVTVYAQSATKKSSAVGTWKFEASYAPEGYQSGTIKVDFADQKHTAEMTFTGSEYALKGENVKASNDSVNFSIYLEGQDIRVFLKKESDTAMSGKAVYSEGEVPLILKKADQSQK